MAKPILQAESEEYEDKHVHQVYEQIASHFSATRYKPWPIVEKFLLDLPDGSVGLDVGCGNGKYLGVNPKLFVIGSDRSSNLAKIASHNQPQVSVIADNLSLPHPPSSFDFAISIAVVHHLSTRTRRVGAISAILETLRPPTADLSVTTPAGSPAKARALIYVWALEQKHSRRGWDEHDEQDVMVPWVTKHQDSNRASTMFNRYYHLFRQGELEEDIDQAGGVVETSGYERDNWWAIAVRKLEP
ncbi:tRNA methyltransferase, has a role in tRNA modification [Peltigera leucophlebia]|nr:tRNA methyltransferase, has a role in tRNA modification [Peltigera leucophlebia]